MTNRNLYFIWHTIAISGIKSLWCVSLTHLAWIFFFFKLQFQTAKNVGFPADMKRNDSFSSLNQGQTSVIGSPLQAASAGTGVRAFVVSGHRNYFPGLSAQLADRHSLPEIHCPVLTADTPNLQNGIHLHIFDVITMQLDKYWAVSAPASHPYNSALITNTQPE